MLSNLKLALQKPPQHGHLPPPRDHPDPAIITDIILKPKIQIQESPKNPHHLHTLPGPCHQHPTPLSHSLLINPKNHLILIQITNRIYDDKCILLQEVLLKEQLRGQILADCCWGGGVA